MAINFTPLTILSMFRDTLREWFLQFGGDFTWSQEPRDNTIWIGTVNDYNSKEAKQKLPRILVKRGPVQMGIQFINDSLEFVSGTQQLPTHNSTMHMNGSIVLMVEASTEGTCEALGEALRRFITRNKPMFEKEFGILRFAAQVSISECDSDTEDKEKFKIQIQVPYIVEDRWNYTPDTILLKKIVGDVKVNINQ